MTLESPLFMQANTVPARQLRELVASLFDVEGVVRPSSGALLVTQRGAGTNMSVDVAAGGCIIAGDDQADQGSYFGKNTATYNVPIGAAPGSNSRIDLIVARMRDATVVGGVSSDWVIEAIPGTVAGSPVAPATPGSAIPLARVLVASGTAAITNAMITDVRDTSANSGYSTSPRLLATTTALGNVDFTSIPQTYKHLLLIIQGATNRAAQEWDSARLVFNGDTSAIYDYQTAQWTGAAADAIVQVSATTFIEIGTLPGATAVGYASGAISVLIPNYTDTNRGKTVIGEFAGRGSSNMRRSVVSGLYHATATPISRIQISHLGTPVAGYEVSLIGLF